MNYNLETLTLQKMNKKIAKSDINALDLENKIYIQHNKVLNEKEKVYFELKRIIDKIKEYDNVQEENNDLYNMINDLFSTFVEVRNNKFQDCNDIKKKIVKVQIYLNMKIGFYSVVKEMLEERFDNKEVKR